MNSTLVVRAARVTLALYALLSAPAAAQTAACSTATSERRVALLELYTSEGCSSCPPADRWVRELAARGLASDRVVVLGFHVDYWDYIGWPDPYAQRRFSERQRQANARVGARFVYTPQIMLDGKDYRRGFWRDDIVAAVAAINEQRPRARLELAIAPGNNELAVWAKVDVVDPVARAGADTYLALLEHRLSSRITAGENRGRQLVHDFVVRQLEGPFPAQQATAPSHRFRIRADWKTGDLAVVVFAQMRNTGAVLQALQLPYCQHRQNKSINYN